MKNVALKGQSVVLAPVLFQGMALAGSLASAKFLFSLHIHFPFPFQKLPLVLKIARVSF